MPVKKKEIPLNSPISDTPATLGASSIPDTLSKQELEKLLNKNNTKDEEFGENLGEKLLAVIEAE